MSDNPQAFPVPASNFGHGMTLRDYFAGQALAGYFAAPNTPHMNAVGPDIAAYLYAIADCLLTERSKATKYSQL